MQPVKANSMAPKSVMTRSLRFIAHLSEIPVASRSHQRQRQHQEKHVPALEAMHRRVQPTQLCTLLGCRRAARRSDGCSQRAQARGPRTDAEEADAKSCQRRQRTEGEASPGRGDQAALTPPDENQ